MCQDREAYLDTLDGDGTLGRRKEPRVRRRVGEEEEVAGGADEGEQTGDDHQPDLHISMALRARQLEYVPLPWLELVRLDVQGAKADEARDDLRGTVHEDCRGARKYRV